MYQSDDEIAVELSEEQHDDKRVIVNDLEKAKKRIESKPNIDMLEDAVITVDDKLKFLPKRGEYVVIERRCTLLSNKPWLDTKKYLVITVNQETGRLELIDEEYQHDVLCNFITGTKENFKFKIPPKKGAFKKRRSKRAAIVSSNKEKVENKQPSLNNNATRRIYATRGIIHTRIKGVAYVPQAGQQTNASDAMRVQTRICGDKLIIKHEIEHWEETWVANKEL